MGINYSKQISTLLIAGTILVSPNIVHAAPILDFGIKAPTTGTLSYDGGVNPLVGSGIDVDDVIGLNTFLNQNIISICSSCTLDFTTGASTGGWDFGAGGTIRLTGGIDFLDSTPDIATGTTLLLGTFNSATVVDLGGGDFEFQILGGSFTDQKHPDLLAFYGLPSGSYIGGLNISFKTTSNYGEAFVSEEIYSGDITNTPTVVPIPAALWLLTSGLVGILGIKRVRSGR
jgi:hypothetical protein